MWWWGVLDSAANLHKGRGGGGCWTVQPPCTRCVCVGVLDSAATVHKGRGRGGCWTVQPPCTRGVGGEGAKGGGSHQTIASLTFIDVLGVCCSSLHARQHVGINELQAHHCRTKCQSWMHIASWHLTACLPSTAHLLRPSRAYLPSTAHLLQPLRACLPATAHLLQPLRAYLSATDPPATA